MALHPVATAVRFEGGDGAVKGGVAVVAFATLLQAELEAAFIACTL